MTESGAGHAVGGGHRGVSPVVGVILMVAITVILAAVVGVFTLGLGDSLGSQQTKAGVSFEQTPTGSGASNVTVTVVTSASNNPIIVATENSVGNRDRALATTDYDILYRNGSDALKVVDSAGNTITLGVSAPTALGGIDDVDGDGRRGAVYGNAAGNLSYVEPSGTVVDMGYNVSDIGTVADVDEDGDLDIVFVDQQANLKYVDAAGNVVDTGKQAADAGGVGDINGDGALDIAYTNTSDVVKFIGTNGNGKSLGREAYGVGGVGFIDNDGDLDVAYRHKTSGYIQYVDYSGDMFGTGILSNSIGDAVADMDGDGDIDIAYRTINDDVGFVDAGGDTTVLSGTQSYAVGGLGDIDRDDDVWTLSSVGDSVTVPNTPAGMEVIIIHKDTVIQRHTVGK